jgi:cytochrome P450
VSPPEPVVSLATRRVITGGMYQLMKNPDQHQMLIEDRSKIPVAIEEMLRWGYGAHFCLGSSLARLELRVMFDRLIERLPELRLASDETPPMRPSNFIVGIERMPVVFEPR